MDAPKQLWEAWREQVKQLFPSLHGHQQQTLAWIVLGVVLSGSAVLQRMAEGLYGISPAKMPSIERRLARFVANDRIQVSSVWNTLPLARLTILALAPGVLGARLHAF